MYLICRDSEISGSHAYFADELILYVYETRYHSFIIHYRCDVSEEEFCEMARNHILSDLEKVRQLIRSADSAVDEPSVSDSSPPVEPSPSVAPTRGRGRDRARGRCRGRRRGASRGGRGSAPVPELVYDYEESGNTVSFYHLQLIHTMYKEVHMYSHVSLLSPSIYNICM